MILCRVTLGKPVEQFTAIRIAHAPPGHHSVIGRPSVGGLNYPEYVIYRGEQVSIQGKRCESLCEAFKGSVEGRSSDVM